jgi:hypothetical protein
MIMSHPHAPNDVHRFQSYCEPVLGREWMKLIQLPIGEDGRIRYHDWRCDQHVNRLFAYNQSFSTRQWILQKAGKISQDFLKRNILLSDRESHWVLCSTKLSLDLLTGQSIGILHFQRIWNSQAIDYCSVRTLGSNHPDINRGCRSRKSQIFRKMVRNESSTI